MYEDDHDATVEKVLDTWSSDTLGTDHEEEKEKEMRRVIEEVEKPEASKQKII